MDFRIVTIHDVSCTPTTAVLSEKVVTPRGVLGNQRRKCLDAGKKTRSENLIDADRCFQTRRFPNDFIPWNRTIWIHFDRNNRRLQIFV